MLVISDANVASSMAPPLKAEAMRGIFFVRYFAGKSMLKSCMPIEFHGERIPDQAPGEEDSRPHPRNSHLDSRHSLRNAAVV